MKQVSGKRSTRLSGLAKVAISLELLLSAGALGGGVALMAGRHGEIIPLPASALSGSPFADYFAPGAILFSILGIGPLVAAVVAWRHHLYAPLLEVAAGGALIVWIIAEVAIVGYSNHPPLQAGYLGLGLVMVCTGALWARQAPRVRARHG